MMELHEALAQVTTIRSQIARTETFHGYRSLTVAFSGLVAVVAGIAQAIWLTDPAQTLPAYLSLWVGAAVLCLCVTGLEMSIRCRRARSAWAVRITWMAVEQFLPCLLAGGMLTAAILLFAADSLWLLPGLWAIVFSLGVFASCRLLPRHLFWVGVYYLAAGAACIAWANGVHAFSPWAMIGTFGGGQTLTAFILYFTLERSGAEKQN